MTEPLLLRSDLLAHVPHAFSTRVGGVSSGAFDSLSLGNPSGLPDAQRDPRANILANLDRIRGALGCDGCEIVQVHQVHGNDAAVLRVGEPCPGIADVKADAILTDDPRRLLCVRVADCTPILLADAAGSVVGAVHAGWRGVIAGAVLTAVREIRALGAGELLAAIGPCIGPEAFEVGPEVALAFDRAFPDEPVVIRGEGKDRVDLKRAIRAQLLAQGVTRIDVLPHCTVREPKLFYSHRRDAGLTGRTGAFIATARGRRA